MIPDYLFTELSCSDSSEESDEEFIDIPIRAKRGISPVGLQRHEEEDSWAAVFKKYLNLKFFLLYL